QFGLYDMLGNVMDWTEDCSNANYSGAPTDGTAWQSGDCGRRVVRGGSWDMDLRVVRSANRRGILTSRRNTTLGFRVARTLEDFWCEDFVQPLALVFNELFPSCSPAGA